MQYRSDRQTMNVALRRVTCNCGENLEYPQGRNAEGVCRCFYTVNESKVSPVQGIHKRDEWYNGCRSDNPRKREPMHRVGNIEFKGSGKKRGKFVIEHCTTDPAALYEVLTEEWNLTPPHLVVSLVGGDEDFQMKPWLRDTLRKGLVKAAQSTGAWIVTSGLRVGITTHVGEAVRDHSLASTSSKVKVIAIGIAPWKMIRDKETLLTAKPGKPAFYETAEQPSGSLYSLDSNHSHFILVDEDERHKDGTTEMRIKLLKHISEQRTGYGGTGIEIPVLCLLVHGQPHILEIQIILEHRHLLTIHNPGQEGSDELDTVILKALVKACKSQSQEAQEYLDELKLAVAWNRVDIAKSEIFSGEVEWRERASISRVSHVQKASLNMNQKCENPWRDLFLWAVLQNRQEMANYFWATGPEAVAAALAGCKILKEMAHLESEAESARSMKEAKYEQFALDLFSECYTNSEDRAFALLVRKTKSWNKTTCLDLATEADAKSFFAHDGVQSHLTKMWWGAMKSDTRIWKLMLSFFCPPLIYTNLITFSEDEHHTVGGAEQFKELDSQDSEKAMLLTQRQNSDTIKPEKQVTASNNVCMKFLFTRWKKFWGAPVTVFLGNVIMYFAFLFLFTYVILVDFQPPPPYGPSIPEITLYFWVFTLVLEELRQSFFTDEDTSIIKKFKLYVEDSWNKCDMVAILLFVLGVSCRMAWSTYEAGRTVLALDFMVFALRLIHIFAIHKQLGPKIIIVERMMKDVFFFLFFLSVWLIAYGVATQALLHPNDNRVDWIFRRVLYRPYLHIFGQIPLEEIDGARMPEQNCTIDPIEIMNETFSPCPNLYANWLVILLLVIFLLVTNVLLLNLLIAMFSYTFQVVQGNADIFWKFQRYNLIVEYFSRPSLAPPFIIISHISQVICSMFKNAEPKQELLERDFPEGLDQKLMTWETVQKENYLANLEKEERESSEERLKKTSHKYILHCTFPLT
ncbi:UNVERIFIED_CONTAM: hypothetical protein FKN15_039387 [Acipenser sinensis]